MTEPLILFVYGTLRRGGPAHHLLEGSSHLGTARTAPRFRKLDLGAYPGLVAGAESVEGELYSVDRSRLSALDDYEGDRFHRAAIDLDDGRTAFTYLYSDPNAEPLNVPDLERIAKARLGAMAFDYYASGADDEVTLRRNREAFERFAIHYRVLVDVSTRRLSTTVLGHEVSLPVLFAPTAFHRMAHPDGEAATARAAGAEGTAMCLSTLSNTDVEVVAKSTSGPLFFQLYVYRDRKVTEALVRRVEAAGCRALVLTVDAPLLGRRERDVKNRFRLPDGLTVKNLVALNTIHGEVSEKAFESGLAAYFSSLVDASLSWKDIDWLASITKLPIVIKGIVRPDDALRARDHGAKAIVVSNHGGRQLDGSPATIDVLGPIARATSGSLELWMDGGVRRGTDVLKALALGARAVLIGRPVLWGLAHGGEAGVRFVVQTLRRELDLAMALAGCPDVASITPDLIASP